jgi:hypothetical protein
MQVRSLHLALTCLATLLFAAACAPASPPPPTVDAVGTMAVELAHGMQTQTAAAHSPTPLPVTPSLTPTITSTPTPAKDPNKKIITVINHTGCYHGPGPNYVLQSYINVPKTVELIGIGSTPGWYVIIGPYFYTACWVAAADVQVDDDVDLARFPVMTPGP